MKKNNLEELKDFVTNITIISFIDMINKLVVRVGIEKKHDIIKQIKAIRNLEQLKM